MDAEVLSRLADGRRLPPDEYNALVDEAKLRAAQLRRAAIDRFWDDVAHALGRLRSAARSKPRAAPQLTRPAP